MASPLHPKILIIGLGNPILGDDGVGWRVAEQAQAELTTPQVGKESLSQSIVEVDFQALGGLTLMERLIGYERAIIADAITTHQHPSGTVLCFPFEKLPTSSIGHISSAHDTSLQDAIAVGRSLGANLPETIMVVGIETDLVYDFTETLSAPVEAAIPEAGRIIVEIMRDWVSQKPDSRP